MDHCTAASFLYLIVYHTGFLRATSKKGDNPIFIGHDFIKYMKQKR